MEWTEHLKARRLLLGETQETFAARFKTTANTVSRWETGTYDVPPEVMWWLMRDQTQVALCPRCAGRGVITESGSEAEIGITRESYAKSMEETKE